MSNCTNGCGCEGHDHHEHSDSKKIYLTLTDSRQLECDVLNIFEVNDKTYIAVLPQDSETALIYGFTEDKEGPQLSNIESEEEYDLASKTFLDIVHSQHH